MTVDGNWQVPGPGSPVNFPYWLVSVILQDGEDNELNYGSGQASFTFAIAQANYNDNQVEFPADSGSPIGEGSDASNAFLSGLKGVIDGLAWGSSSEWPGYVSG